MATKIKSKDLRSINLQYGQDNFYHFCSLLFPDMYNYHGHLILPDKKIVHPEKDYELPGLNQSEKQLLAEYKNFDNISDMFHDGTFCYSPIMAGILDKARDFAALRRRYLYIYCNVLQAFYENRLVNGQGKPYQKLMINMPPRMRKTLTLKLITIWILGKNQTVKFFALSYGRTLSIKFGKEVRNFIEEQSLNPDWYVYSNIFPNTRIKADDRAKECWSLEGEAFTLLSTSPDSTQTGIGFDIVIIDDIVKSALHYYNENRVQEDWDYITNTLLSRKESSKAKMIISMTRWGKNDIAARFLEQEGNQWAVIRFPAYDPTQDLMLDSSVMTKEDYLNRKTLTNPDIFSANYQQEVIELTGYLYKPFKTYRPQDLPESFEFIGFHIDTADQGDNYLAGGFFGYAKSMAWMLEVIYTQLNAEETEIDVCNIIIKLKATTGIVESNSGGHGYARNIRRILTEKKYNACSIDDIPQGENKVARILTARTNVVNSIIMPADWQERWPEYYKHMTRALINGKWEFDDAMDMTTGIYEKYIEYEPVLFR